MRLSNGRVQVESGRTKNSQMRVEYANMQVLDHSLMYTQIGEKDEDHEKALKEEKEVHNDDTNL